MFTFTNTRTPVTTQTNGRATIEADYQRGDISTYKGVVLRYQDAAGAPQEDRFFLAPDDPEYCGTRLALGLDILRAEAQARALNLEAKWDMITYEYMAESDPEMASQLAADKAQKNARLYMAAMCCGLIAATAYSVQHPVGDFEVDVNGDWHSSLFLLIDSGPIVKDMALDYALILHAGEQAHDLCSSVFSNCMEYVKYMAIKEFPDPDVLTTSQGQRRLMLMIERLRGNLYLQSQIIEARHSKGIEALTDVLVARGSIKEEEAEEILRTHDTSHCETSAANTDRAH